MTRCSSLGSFMIGNGVGSVVIFGDVYQVSITLPINHHVAHSCKPASVVVLIHPLVIFEWCGVSEMGKDCKWTLEGSDDGGKVATGKAEGESVVEEEVV